MADDLMACFTASILQIDSSEIRRLCREYDLSILKSRDLRLSILPEDGIDRVILREITFSLPEVSERHRRVTFWSDPNIYSEPDVHSRILRSVHPDEVDIDDVEVTSARFTVIFRSDDGRRSNRITFVVSTGCSLGDLAHEQIIKRCLRR